LNSALDREKVFCACRGNRGLGSVDNILLSRKIGPIPDTSSELDIKNNDADRGDNYTDQRS